MDLVVVGGGLIGSAAAKYLAEAGHNVTVFVAPEPESYDELGILGRPLASHYDEGRITRITDRDPYWADVARRSIERYRSIERQSGIGFFIQRPLVYMAPNSDELVTVGQAHGAAVAPVTAERITAMYGLHRPDGYNLGGVAHETAPAGFINPRRLVRAQLTLAHNAGASIIPWPAALLSGGSDRKPVTVTGVDGTTVIADRVLLATGAYGASLADVVLPLECRLRTVALLEVSGTGPDLPVLIMSGLNRPGLSGIYWVPPIHYPDGRVYLKIGGDVPLGPTVREGPGVDLAGAIAEWFQHGGSRQEVADLVAVAREILPDREVQLAGRKPCVVTYSPDNRPMIDWIDDRIATAFAGCGAAAKSGDAIGFDAAQFVSS